MPVLAAAALTLNLGNLDNRQYIGYPRETLRMHRRLRRHRRHWWHRRHDQKSAAIAIIVTIMRFTLGSDIYLLRYAFGAIFYFFQSRCGFCAPDRPIRLP